MHWLRYVISTYDHALISSYLPSRAYPTTAPLDSGRDVKVSWSALYTSTSPLRLRRMTPQNLLRSQIVNTVRQYTPMLQRWSAG